MPLAVIANIKQVSVQHEKVRLVRFVYINDCIRSVALAEIAYQFN